MNTLFDEDGNALETTVVTVYAFNNESAEYSGFYDVRILSGTGIPGSTTLITPPTLSNNQTAIFNGTSWEVVADYRGNKVYAIDTGVASVVDYLGAIRDGYTAIAPSTAFDRWNGKEWVTDSDALHKANIRLADTEKRARIAAANEYINAKQWPSKLSLGRLSDTDKRDFNIWLDYIDAVEAISIATEVDIDWPDLPNP